MVTKHQRPTSDRNRMGFLATWWQRRATERQLNALSDRALADIGIAREHIPLVVRGIDPLQHEAGLGRPRWAAGLLAWLEAVHAERRELRRIRRELATYDDRDLDDLGIRRFVVHGGDLGTAIADQVALLAPDRVAGLHLTDAPLWRAADDEELSAEEREWVERMVARLEAADRRRNPGEDDLLGRACELSRRFLDGLARPSSVTWV